MTAMVPARRSKDGVLFALVLWVISLSLALALWPVVFGLGLLTGSRGPERVDAEYFLLRAGKLEPMDQSVALIWSATDFIALVAVISAAVLGLLLWILLGGVSPFKIVSEQHPTLARLVVWTRLAFKVECVLVALGLVYEFLTG